MYPIKTAATINKTIHGDENSPNNEQDISCENSLLRKKLDLNSRTFSQNGKKRSSALESVVSEEKERTAQTEDKNVADNIDKISKEASKFSFFDEADCGELMIAQHLRIDFTPTEHDSGEVSDKCNEFWKSINTRSDLQQFKVYPVKPDSISVLSQSIVEPKRSSSPCLDWVVNDGKMTGAFMCEEKKTYCEQPRGDYRDVFYDEQIKKTVEIGVKANKMISYTTKLQDEVKRKSCRSGIRGTSTDELRKLSRDMDDWDTLHPRPMEAPGQVPLLNHAVMKRKM